MEALLSKITAGDKSSSEESVTKPPENHRTSILQEIAEAVRNLGVQSRENRRDSDRWVSIEIFNTKTLFLNAGRSFFISWKTDIKPDFQLTILMTLLARKLLGFRPREVLWLAPEVDYSSLQEPSAKRASGPQSFSHYQLGILTVTNYNPHWKKDFFRHNFQ